MGQAGLQVSWQLANGQEIAYYCKCRNIQDRTSLDVSQSSNVGRLRFATTAVIVSILWMQDYLSLS